MEQPRPLIEEGGEEQLIEAMSDDIFEYMRSTAREQIFSAIGSAGEDLRDTMATMTYQIITETSKKIAQVEPRMVTIEVLFPLVTEIIDNMIEIAQAQEVPLKDLDLLREEVLGKTLEIHFAKVGDDPEQKAIAKEMFAELVDDGSLEAAQKHYDERYKAQGGDPQDLRQTGAEMVAPRQNPVAAGVSQGLMQQGGR